MLARQRAGHGVAIVVSPLIALMHDQVGALDEAGVPADALDAEVERLAASIVAKPRVAIALGKQLFYRQLEGGIAAAYEDAGRTMACNMMDGSALEGVQAFIDKRPPNW